MMRHIREGFVPLVIASLIILVVWQFWSNSQTVQALREAELRSQRRTQALVQTTHRIIEDELAAFLRRHDRSQSKMDARLLKGIRALLDRPPSVSVYRSGDTTVVYRSRSTCRLPNGRRC